MSARSSIRKTDAVTVRRVAPGGEAYDVILDRHGLALYRRYRWQRHDKGLIRYPSKKHHRGSVFLHRQIMAVGPELYIVHRNGNKFDCRRENLEVITWQEQRDRKRCPRRPYFITRTRKGTPTGVSFPTKVHHLKDGRAVVYRMARAHFCTQGKERSTSISIDRNGLNEAVRRALAWRVQMIRDAGMEPNVELLDSLQRVTRMARAGGGFEEIYGGNAEYQNNKVVAREVAHWAQPWEEAA